MDRTVHTEQAKHSALQRARALENGLFAPKRWVRNWTIQRKLLALILIPMVSIVAVLGVYFPARQLATLEGNLEQRAVTYGRLVGKQMRSVVAFDDNETAREVFEALAQDPMVASIVLFTQRGDILQSYGVVKDAALAARRGVQREHVFVLHRAILVVSPVQSLEGPRGTLAIELSTVALEKSRTQVRATALVVGLSVLFGGVLAAFLIARSFAGRLRALAAVAARVTDGDLDAQQTVDDSRDEIGVLTSSFNAMLDRLRSLIVISDISSAVQRETAKADEHKRAQELESTVVLRKTEGTR